MSDRVLSIIRPFSIWLLLFSALFFLVLPHYKSTGAIFAGAGLLLYVLTSKNRIVYLLYAFPLVIPVIAMYLPLPMSSSWPGLLRLFIIILFWGAIFIINAELSRQAHRSLPANPHFFVKDLD